MTNPPTPPQLRPRDGTVFISYARADDLRPPNEDTTDGWVTFFWNNLRWELTYRGAKNAELWLDRYKIDPAEAFTPCIETAVRNARLIIPVFSENWALSRWCREEVDAFGRAHDDADDLVVPVFKENVDRKLLPPLLQGEQAKEGYRFFEIDPRGELHEFYWRGLQNREAYNAMVRRIAKFIITQLDDVDPPREDFRPSSTGRTVFIAETANELRDARQRLVNDLAGAGHTVVPQIDQLPGDLSGYSEAIQAALGLADMAVFILGEKHGDSPSGTDEAIIDIQLRLAREPGARPSAPRVLWAPKWLPGLMGNKRDPFDVAGKFGGVRTGEELFGEEVTDLSQWLRERLAPKRAQESIASGPILIMAAESGDDDLAFDLARLLQSLSRRVQPVASDEPFPPTSAGSPAVVLFVWAAAQRATLEAGLNRLPPGLESICLILPGGDEKAKRRFFREGVVAEMLPALPADRAAARALLDRLDLLPKEAQ